PEGDQPGPGGEGVRRRGDRLGPRARDADGAHPLSPDRPLRHRRRAGRARERHPRPDRRSSRPQSQGRASELDRPCLIFLDLPCRPPQNSCMSEPNIEPNQELRVEIKGLMLDPSSNIPIVILRDTESQLFLPIWIGVFEANAIALRIEGVEPPRPMTHDLLRLVLEKLGATVEKIVISDLRESTFFALIHLRQGGQSVAVDARPSDAIALALRTEAPIYVLR